MTRNHFSTSFIGNSCVRVPVNPYNQQPSPSYERMRLTESNRETKGMRSLRKDQDRPISASSRAPSSSNGNCTKDGAHLRQKENGSYSEKKSPLDSFLDFYESIPDYQEVTHLSDSEFADKVKLLREKHRQYIDNLGGKYNATDYKEIPQVGLSFTKKKSLKLSNKLELAKEWVNKSCESLSSLGKKSEHDYRIRETEEDTPTLKVPSMLTNSPRKYLQYNNKDDYETYLMDTGSSLSTDSNAMKQRESRMSCDKQCQLSNRLSIRDDETSILARNRLESCSKGLSNVFSLKERHVRPTKSQVRGKNRPSSGGIQSSETSEINTLDCISPLDGVHNEISGFEEYYLPPGWLKSDSESILEIGTRRNTSSVQRTLTQASQSLPGSPVLKRSAVSGNYSSDSEKKKRKKKRKTRRGKSPTKPVPFSFMRNEKSYFSRSTPDLISRCRSPSPKLFRARPIPRNLFSNYIYQKRQEEEFFRALKRKVRAEEMLRAASLPPSMEFRERLSRVQAEAEADVEAQQVASGGSGGSSPGPAEHAPGDNGRPGRPRRKSRARRPPDFAKCHEKMRQELRDRQSRNITTSPSPYSLRTASLSPRRKDTCSSPGSRCRPRSSLNLSATSRSNLAALLRIQTARQRLEAEHRRLREEQSRRTEMRLKARMTRLTPAWRSIQYTTEEDLALRAAVRREEERARRQEHGLLMRHMLHRVHTIPTLFERQSAQAPPHAYPRPTTRFRPRRSSRRSNHIRDEDCGPSCSGVDDLDEDAADVMRGYPRSSARPIKRPSSCGATIGRSSRPGSSRVCEDPVDRSERERDDYGDEDDDDGEEEEVVEEVDDDDDDEEEGEDDEREQQERAASP